MSSAVTRDPGGRDDSLKYEGGAPRETETAHLGRKLRYLDRELVDRLVAELATHEPTGVFPARIGASFNRHEAEERIGARAAVGAERAVEVARSRKIIPSVPTLPDTEYTDALESKVYRARGYSHYLTELPYQDSYAVRIHAPSGTHCSVVADGVSSVPLSQHAAAIMSRALAQIAEELVIDQSGAFRVNGSFMNSKFLHALYTRTIGAYLDLCEETGYHPEDAAERFMATTLQLSVVTPKECAMVALSDGLFSFSSSYQEVAALMRRGPLFANLPPLIERAILDESVRQRGAGNPPRSLDREELFLLYEAESFHVVGYGASSEVVPRVVEMATDGGQYTDMLPSRQGTYFPLVELAVIEDRGPVDVEVALHLSHLHPCGERLTAIEEVQRGFTRTVEEEHDRSLGEGDLLERFLRRVDPSLRGDANIAVRDFLRTLPRGRSVTDGFGRDTDLATSAWAIGRLRDQIEMESFSLFLELERARYERAVLAVARDIAAQRHESKSAERFCDVIRAVVAKARGEGSLAGAELEANWIAEETDAEVLLQVIERDSVAFLDLRREVVRGAIEGGTELLRIDFSVDPATLSSPVFDDITWLAVGPQ